MAVQPTEALEALAALAGTVRAIRGIDVSGLAEPALVAGFEALLEAETALRAAQAAWLAAVDAREATVAECGRATRSWLVEELRLNPADATRRLRLARELPAVPTAESAFGDGRISSEHAFAVLTAVREVPVEARGVVEAALVELAETQPPFVVARAVDQVLETLGVDCDAGAAYARRFARRGVDLAETFAGSGSLSGTLSPDGLETLRVALAAASPPAGPDDERTASQRRHDGLVDIAAFYLAHAKLADVSGERPRVVVTIAMQVLQDGLAGHGMFDSGAPLSAAAARRLACDAEIVPAVLGARSEVLDVGSATRSWPTAIRRAARLRDQGRCAYPRCTRPVSDLHHITWWSEGGGTSLENAAWLCAFHHWLVHEAGWRMRREPDGRCTFTSPDGRQHRVLRHPKAAAPPVRSLTLVGSSAGGGETA